MIAGAIDDNSKNFGNSWKAHACDDNPPTIKDSCVAKIQLHLYATKKCHLMFPPFDKCKSVVSPQSFYRDCMQVGFSRDKILIPF